jgi:MFS family permease
VSGGARRYLEVLRMPHVAALTAAVLLARFPIGINGLAIILYVRERTGSFAIAGAVAGALAAGSAVGAPVLGRLVDRRGQRRVLIAAGIVHAAALGALVADGESGAHTVVLLAAGFVAGFAVPPASAVLRSMWPALLRGRPDLQQAAFALDSVMIELIFIAGPLLTAALTAIVSPATALIVSAVSVVAGTVWFTAQPPSRESLPDPEAGSGGVLGALRSPGIRSLVLISVPAGAGLGICEVALPAFSAAQGGPELAGVLLAIWSLGSAAGGLIYGGLSNRPPLDRVHLMMTAALPLSILPMVAANSFELMALLVIPAGMFIAPLLASRNELVALVAPAGARTEAYTWPVTAFVGGIAGGAALAGAVVEGPGWRAALLIAVGFAAVGAAIAFARRGTLGAPAVAA